VAYILGVYYVAYIFMDSRSAASVGVYYQGLASTGTSQEYGSSSAVLGAKSWASWGYTPGIKNANQLGYEHLLNQDYAIA
jgi:hypothetical protein